MPMTVDHVNSGNNTGIDGYCLDCNYSLRGLSSDCCPECGRTFNREDPKSFFTKSPPGPIRRFFLRPIGWPTCLVFTLIFVLILWGAIHPTFYYLVDFGVLIFLWSLVPIYCVLRFALASLAAVGRHSIEPAWIGRLLLLFLMPLILTVLIATRLPLRLAFLTAKPGLDRLVQSVGPDLNPNLTSDQNVGLFTISARGTSNRYQYWFHADSGRIVFMLANEPESGFIYSPNGIENLRYNSGNKGHLIGNWYWMTQD